MESCFAHRALFGAEVQVFAGVFAGLVGWDYSLAGLQTAWNRVAAVAGGFVVGPGVLEPVIAAGYAWG